MKKNIYFTVTNDLVFDQRMQRICSSLSNAGYNVTLVGRKVRDSSSIIPQKYKQVRLSGFASKGPLMYLFFNLRLFFFLLPKKADAICAIDLDTIIPVYWATKIKGIKRIYDAHELFTEMKEVLRRPAIRKLWNYIERTYVPQFDFCYTVCQSIANEFKMRYGSRFYVIRNLPLASESVSSKVFNKWLLYQGAVNEARGFEYLIPAMKRLDLPLHIYGTGNFLAQTEALISANKVKERVMLHEPVAPQVLHQLTKEAYVGINLVENMGLNQYFSLANKFFDYIQAGVPQVSMNFPEYKRVNDHFEVAVLIDELTEEAVFTAISELVHNVNRYEQIRENCLKARQYYTWQMEEKELLSIYKKILPLPYA